MKARIIKKGMITPHHFSSSIWCNINKYFKNLSQDSIINIINGLNTNLWMDNWLGVPLINLVQHPHQIDTNLMVASYIDHGSRHFPAFISELVPDIQEKFCKSLFLYN